MRSRDIKALAGGEIHVYCADLDQPESRIHQLQSLLARDEQQRADRFRFEPDKNRFIVCRGILRIILSNYLGIEAGSVEFEYGVHGKPALRINSATQTLRFSLSHSHSVAVYALTCNQQIGVDVERIRQIPGASRIVERYFTPRESAVYRSLALGEKEQAFFRAWTCKEAYLKAVGTGLGQSLSSVEVSMAPGEAPRLLMIEGSPATAGGWSLRLFKPKPHYLATLATEARSCQLRFWKVREGAALCVPYHDGLPG